MPNCAILFCSPEGIVGVGAGGAGAGPDGGCCGGLDVSAGHGLVLLELSESVDRS